MSKSVRPLYLEDKGKTHILKVGKYLQADTASHTRRFEFPSSTVSKKTFNY